MYEITKMPRLGHILGKITSFMGYFESFWEFWYFGYSTWCSAKSQKNFLDKQSETCQKRLSCGKISALSKMYEIIKSRRLGHILDNSTSLYVILRVLQSFDILATVLVALRDPRKLFSTSNLRLVKKDSAWRKTPLETTTDGIQKYHTFQGVYGRFYVIMCDISMFFCFWCFGKGRRGSARSQKKILDNQSETCQKKLQLQVRHLSKLQHMKITNITHLMTNIHDSLAFYVLISWFSALCVLARAEGALRDPRNFFSTSNLRFVKRVSPRSAWRSIGR